jgi:hypothetical protein
MALERYFKDKVLFTARFRALPISLPVIPLVLPEERTIGEDLVADLTLVRQGMLVNCSEVGKVVCRGLEHELTGLTLGEFGPMILKSVGN